MKLVSRYSTLICIGLLAMVVGCRGSKQKASAASTPPDTMLLRDLAEANKNTASAGAEDNSLTTLRTTGADSSRSAILTAETPVTHTEVRPSGAPSTPSAGSSSSAGSDETPARKANTKRPAKVLSEAPPSSGDPCDSPTPVDQRTCLNRSIVINDADLNSTYQEVIAQANKSGGSELEERIREAQREWINTRDEACRPDNGGTGLWARAVARCLADYSARRTAELQRTLNGLRGQ